MKVCVVDLTGIFGPLRSYLEVAGELAVLGHELTLVVREDVADQVRIRAPAAKVLGLGESAAHGSDFRAALEVSLRLQATPDLIHSNTTSAARVGILIATACRRPHLLHLRNSALSTKEKIFVAALTRGPFRTTTVAVSALAASVAGVAVRRRTEVIPDAVTPGPTHDHVPSLSPIRIGVVVNTRKTKGFDLFASIVGLTLDLPIEWHVFGSASFRESAPFVAAIHDRLAASDQLSRIVFRGIVPSLSEVLPEIDMMLVTSRRESYSRVTVESLMARLPVVAPKIPGLVESIGDGVNVFLYPVEDVHEASSRIREIIAHFPDEENRDDARRRAVEQFSPASVACRLDRLYARAAR